MKVDIEFIKDVHQYKTGDHRVFPYKLATKLIKQGYAKKYTEEKKAVKKDK